jgi:hypothetical protein
MVASINASWLCSWVSVAINFLLPTIYQYHLATKSFILTLEFLIYFKWLVEHAVGKSGTLIKNYLKGKFWKTNVR